MILSLLLYYFLTTLSITLLTLLIMTISLGFVNKNFKYFLLLLFFSFLLREDIAIHSLPYIVVGTLILKPKISYSKKDLYSLIIFSAFLVLSINSKNIDKNYMEWLNFNKSRTMYNDLSIKDTELTITEDELYYIKNWQIQDNKLVNSENLTNTPLSLFSKIDQIIKEKNYNLIINHKFNYIILFLVVISMILILLRYKNSRLFLYSSLIGGIILLILIRDVERTTIPLFLLWSFIVYEDSKESLKSYSKYFLLAFLCILIYYNNAFIINFDYKEKLVLQKEALSLIQSSDVKVELSIYFPTDFKFNEILSNNIMFDEINWINSKNNILPAGWTSRTDLFYKTHNISHNKDIRKYQNYYEFLMDNKTAFIGGKKINQSLNNRVLKGYDQHYLPKDSTCKHKVYILKESSNFSITQIRLDCKEGQEK